MSKRQGSAWVLVFWDPKDARPLRDASIAVKRAFLRVAGDFFDTYLKMAVSYAERIGEDIVEGRAALDRLREKLT